MDDVIASPTRHRLDVHAFHRMAEAGIFGHTDRIELIEGDLIDMAPIGQGHAAIVGGLSESLFFACAGKAIVWIQNPIRLDLLSEPQPDLAVLRRRADFYGTGDRPGPTDTLLVVEVSDTSLRFDRSRQTPLYARAGIAEFWIVDLNRRRLECHRVPQGDAYTQVTTHTAGDTLALAAAPDILVSLNLVFG